MRAALDRRNELDLVVEHAPDALDDREPEAEAARHLGALLEALELGEHDPLLRLRNADAGVVDVDAHAGGRGGGSRPARGPAVVYLTALETRFCSSRRSSRRSERTVSEHGTKTSRSPFSRASGANSTSSWRSSSSMRKLAISGLSAPVSRREMSSSAPMISSTASSEASTWPASRATSPPRLPLDQAGDVEPRRVERLQDVVARGREKARLGDIGLVRRRLGAQRARR